MNWAGIFQMIATGLFVAGAIGAMLCVLLSAPESNADALRRSERIFMLCVWAMGISIVLFILLPTPARAAQPAAPARMAVQIPDQAAMYRHFVEDAAAEVWGVDAPTARLAAQLHQESRFRPHARSGVGAQGMAQFMPATARWIAQAFPAKLGQFDPWDPRQAALAAATYDDWLLRRNPGATTCDGWAFAFSAYNGGENALHREQALAARAGADPHRWFGQVERFRARAPQFWAENRGYPRNILTVLEPAYIAAGWPGKEACA